jgi:hypothetical protein
VNLKQPNEMTAGQRFLLTIVIVLIILFALAAFGYFTGGWEAQGQVARQDQVDIYSGIEPDAQLIQLDRLALREAYHQQVVGLWTIWLKGQAGDPTYFKNGLQIARRAYAQALTQISKRESEIMERAGK